MPALFVAQVCSAQDTAQVQRSRHKYPGCFTSMCCYNNEVNSWKETVCGSFASSERNKTTQLVFQLYSATGGHFLNSLFYEQQRDDMGYDNRQHSQHGGLFQNGKLYKACVCLSPAVAS